MGSSEKEADDAFKDRYEFGAWLYLKADGDFMVQAHAKKWRHILIPATLELLMEGDLLRPQDKDFLAKQKTNPDYISGWQTFAYVKGRSFFNLLKFGRENEYETQKV